MAHLETEGKARRLVRGYGGGVPEIWSQLGGGVEQWTVSGTSTPFRKLTL